MDELMKYIVKCDFTSANQAGIRAIMLDIAKEIAELKKKLEDIECERNKLT